MVGVGIDFDGGDGVGAFGEAAAGDIEDGLIAPVGLIEVEDVFFQLTVGGDEAFVIPAGYAAFMAGGDGEVKDVPDEGAPDPGAFFDGGPGVFVDFVLPFFGVPLAAGFGVGGIVFVLVGVGAGAVLAEAVAAVAAGGAVEVEGFAPIFGFTFVPAGVFVPAEEVGDFIHFGVVALAGGGDGGAGGVFYGEDEGGAAAAIRFLFFLFFNYTYQSFNDEYFKH